MADQDAKESKVHGEEAQRLWKMARFRPPMDFMRAKLALGIYPGKDITEIELDEIHKRFVTQNTRVSRNQNF